MPREYYVKFRAQRRRPAYNGIPPEMKLKAMSLLSVPLRRPDAIYRYVGTILADSADQAVSDINQFYEGVILEKVHRT